jgi:hypothetical protein
MYEEGKDRRREGRGEIGGQMVKDIEVGGFRGVGCRSRESKREGKEGKKITSFSGIEEVRKSPRKHRPGCQRPP